MPAGAPNLVGLTQFDNKEQFFGPDSPNVLLTEGAGYGVVVGFGFFFAALTVGLVYGDYRARGGRHYNSEDFNCAGRTIKTGLIAVDVVSHWTWSSTLLTSSLYVYLYGISGAFWYAAGAVVQIFLFGVMAIEIKRKAPRAHTVLELVRMRWGNVANWVFFYICILNNTFICVLLYLGAGAVFNAATGMNIYAAVMLIPLSVCIYTVVGGLKATFTSSYLHTVIIYVTVCLFAFKFYASDLYPVGSISKVWDNLNIMAEGLPVPGNQGGSYLTIMSSGGLQFGILQIVASFGNVWADQAYWQSAIASTPTAAWQGYILGGLLWFPVPFTLATSLGIACVALDLPVSVDESNMGLVAVASASYVLGKSGVMLMLIIIFMAVTSAGSAEMMAVSSLFTYDIYKAYIRPKAKGNELLLVSRIAIFVFGIFSGGLCAVLYVAGVSVNFIFLVVGIVVSSALPPLIFLLTWKRVPKGAAIAAALGGQAAAIIAWLVHTKIVYEVVDINTTQGISPTMDGTIVAVGVSAIICVVWTLVAPEKNPDVWTQYKSIELQDDEFVTDPYEEDPAEMDRALKCTWIAAGVLSVVFCIIWPVLTIPAGAFSKGYFTFFVIISIIWALIASFIAIFLPLWESRDVFARALGISPAEKTTLPTATKPGAKPDDSAHHGTLEAPAKKSME
ncbi:urea active transporter [Coccomyxa subellipsoidea C-169]|uniref:Urea active transporter n=1 Tax=Coccomyxa subellipsoidea (strain C-169) TaxID=574566 RepID=I0YXU9_COCSC|nr:urea active transporter [Coccomyxa subellipsoidea C-169]EIE23218.1 urea active transporter [Coccomyxa subellipsoidea C-169]|eukprot:XP_005647762.1 urea active transporter [Coccomyxa subellipsoidea C-169]